MLEMGVKEEHMGGREGGMSAYVQQKNAIGSARHAHPAGEWVIPRGERGKTMARLNGGKLGTHRTLVHLLAPIASPGARRTFWRLGDGARARQGVCARMLFGSTLGTNA